MMMFSRCLKITVILCLALNLYLIIGFRNRLEPTIVLWSWQVSDDLSFIDPNNTAVAPLLATIQVDCFSRLTIQPRINHLITPKNTILIPVFRLRIAPTLLDDDVVKQIVNVILSMSKQSQLIQLDWDVKYSQRTLYKNIIERLTQNLRKIALATLASNCTCDKWLESLPIEYAVPMLYRGGRDESRDFAMTTIKEVFKRTGRWRIKKCRNNVGLIVNDEIYKPQNHRLFVFNKLRWNKSTYDKLMNLD